MPPGNLAPQYTASIAASTSHSRQNRASPRSAFARCCSSGPSQAASGPSTHLGDPQMDAIDVKVRRAAPLNIPTDLAPAATKDISGALTVLLADVFALYLKTKNFHWHMSGRHFRDYHLLLDEQADQIFAATDAIAERARKIGGKTLHSIGEVGRLQRLLDNDADYVTPRDMLAELRDDNKQLT